MPIITDDEKGLRLPHIAKEEVAKGKHCLSVPSLMYRPDGARVRGNTKEERLGEVTPSSTPK